MRAELAAAFVVVAIAAGIGGYLVAQQLSPAEVITGVSAISLPATPTPSPSPTPTPGPSSRVTINGRSGSGQGGQGGRSCPAGCTCDFPPGGAIYRCEGN